MATKKKGAVGVGAGVIAAAAGLAAGYYFYASKDAKKHRKIASKWAVDLKKDVVAKAKTVKNLDQKSMMAIVDQASKAYRGMRTLDKKEIDKAVKELKANWKHMASELKVAGAVASKTAKAGVKKAKVVGKSGARVVKKTIAKAKKSVTQ